MKGNIGTSMLVVTLLVVGPQVDTFGTSMNQSEGVYVALGDSNTLGFTDTTEYWDLIDNWFPNLTVYEEGFSGKNASNLWDNFETSVSNHYDAAKDNWLSIFTGINDSYQLPKPSMSNSCNYIEMIATNAQAMGFNVIVIPYYNWSGDYALIHNPEQHRILNEMAEEHGWKVCDFAEKLDDPSTGEMNVIYWRNPPPDPWDKHMNNAAHFILAESIAEILSPPSVNLSVTRSDDALSLSWNSAIDSTYRILMCTNLSDSSWGVVTNIHTGTNAKYSVSFSDVSAYKNQFFRREVFFEGNKLPADDSIYGYITVDAPRGFVITSRPFAGRSTVSELFSDNLPVNSAIHIWDASNQLYSTSHYMLLPQPPTGSITNWNPNLDIGAGEGFWISVPANAVEPEYKLVFCGKVL